MWCQGFKKLRRSSGTCPRAGPKDWTMFHQRSSSAPPWRLPSPLYNKATLSCLQPTQWRGGVLFEAFKGRGSAAALSNFRSLFISSIPGKSLCKILRKRLCPVLVSSLHETHCGIAKGRGVTLPTHMLRLVLRKLNRDSRPAAALFLDTATAY